MTKKKITNIDEIVDNLKMNLKNLQFEKIDGITIECISNNKDISNRQLEIQKVCTLLGLNPISIELNNEYKNKLALQFPDFINSFEEDQLTKLFIDNFKWLLDNLFQNDRQHIVNRELLIRQKDMFVKQALSIYYRSYANSYKEKLEDLLNNIELRNKLDHLYLTYLEDYLNNKNK